MRISSITPIIQNKNLNKQPKRPIPNSDSMAFKSRATLQKNLLKDLYELGLDKGFVLRNLEKLKNIHLENFKKFFNLINNYEESVSNKLTNLHEIFKDSDVDIDSYIKLISRLKDENVSSKYFKQILAIGREDKDSDIYSTQIQPLYMIAYPNFDETTQEYTDEKDEKNEKKTDFSKINEFLDFRLKARKSLAILNRYNRKATDLDLDEILIENPKLTQIARELLGDETLIYSFKEKKDNVIDYIKSLGELGNETRLFEQLMIITNPHNSKQYKHLEKEIKELKAKFKQAKSVIELEEIKNKINTKTREKYQIVRDSIKDPKDILEKSLIVAALYSADLKDSAKNLIEIIKNKDKTQFNDFLEKELYKLYNLELPHKEVLEKLNFKDSKYFPKLFTSKAEFKNVFRKLIKLINAEPEKSFSEIFNELHYNKQTKDDFENVLNINYYKWNNFDPDSYLTFGKENNRIKIQKANMNNIVHSLFLGEDATCCTKINGQYGSSSISYILSKMIQCIEVYHNSIPVGNTMCYLALVNSKPALILDNIEIKKQYSNDNLIRDGIFAYAKQMMEELGHPEFSIFLSAKRNDINTENLESGFYNIKIIGNSGDNPIYIDHKVNTMLINDETRELQSVKLYKISKNCPEPTPGNKSFLDISDIYFCEDMQSDLSYYNFYKQT